MSSIRQDYSVFNKFNLERKPVGIKFLITRPEGMARINKALNFCEMLREAQTSKPFYVARKDWQCVEPMLLGMEDPEPILISGLFGAREGLFREARACRKMYQYLPKMLKGSVNYVALSSIDKLTFTPDVLVITATVSQAQTLLRSVGYSTGDFYSSKATPVAMCAWLFIYPVLTGELNYTVTGLSLGMQALRVFPEGLVLISVPWNLLPTMVENLQELKLQELRMQKLMKGTMPTPPGGEGHRKRVNKVMAQLRREIKK